MAIHRGAVRGGPGKHGLKDPNRRAPPRAEPHTLILTDYTLHIEERLRGTAPDRISITVPGGTLGKISDDTCISVHLEVGARYLLFLDDLDHPTLTPVVGAGQGMFREAPGTRSGRLSRPHPSLG